MYRLMEQDVCLIGFGEAGATFARAGDWAAAAHIFDIKTNDPATRDAILAAYADAGVTGAGSLEDALRDAGLLLSLVAFVCGGIAGLLILLARLSRLSAPRILARGYIELFQGTPLLMQLFLVFFGIALLGIDVSPWLAAATALTLFTSAFLAEIEVPNEDGAIPAGISAQVTIPTGTAKAHFIRPSVVSLGPEGNLGIKTFEDDRVAFHPIEIVKTEIDGVWATGLPDDAEKETLLIEAGVVGREIECAVLGNTSPRASTVGEVVVAEGGFYAYDTKYVDDSAEVVIPADLAATTIEAVQQVALATYKTLDCRGLARVDVFVTDDAQVIVNEINTLPGFTRISMYPKLWAASGIAYRELVGRLIDLARERHAADRALATSM